ncbi:hypothetical protein [Cupriavidus pauculus]|uniref:hypothetical protein n=1 Tax=Cupriavidus pauculus TaxID=82633 RepID=UPI001246CA8A|nr:hypothetical protein [Cupriavidus pauculus]KAB0601559.1 hypothetical protein F7R19_16955 [Cupriavidus pauculus]UAL01378.1 hypothetical protein K8O84_08705 [Cupriavidus pauculus]
MNRSLAIALAAVLTLLVAAGAGAWFTDRYREAVRRAAASEAMVASLRAQLDSTDASVVEVIKYVDRVQTIHVNGDTIVKEIPRYVTVVADAACTVPGGFVRLHDAAATGSMLDSDPGGADAAPSGIPLSAVAGIVAGNYTTGRVNAARLTALQDTLRAQGVTIIGEPAQ